VQKATQGHSIVVPINAAAQVCAIAINQPIDRKWKYINNNMGSLQFSRHGMQHLLGAETRSNIRT